MAANVLCLIGCRRSISQTSVCGAAGSRRPSTMTMLTTRYPDVLSQNGSFIQRSTSICFNFICSL